VNGTHQLVCADNVNLLGINTRIINKTTETLLDTSKRVDLEVNKEGNILILRVIKHIAVNAES
jgi:hypothetical protein